MHVQTNPYALTGDYGFPVTKAMRLKSQEASMVAPPMVVSKDKGFLSSKDKREEEQGGVSVTVSLTL